MTDLDARHRANVAAVHCHGLIPVQLSAGQLMGVADHIERVAELLGLTTQGQCNLLGDLVSEGFDLAEHTLSPVPDPPPPDPNPNTPTGDLLTMFLELAGPLGEKMPVPPNPFLVGGYGSGIFIGKPPPQRISNAEAIMLAVWMIALADPDLTSFAPLLAKVMQL